MADRIHRATGKQRRRREAGRGFTLLELMTVVGIIGILATLAIGMSADFVRKQKFRALVRGVFSAMSTARAEALRRGVTTMVRLEIAGDNSAERVVAFIDGASGTAGQYDATSDTLLFVYPRNPDNPEERVNSQVIVASMRTTHSSEPLAVFDSRGYCTNGAGSLADVFLCMHDEVVNQRLAVEATVAGAMRVVDIGEATASCSF